MIDSKFDQFKLPSPESSGATPPADNGPDLSAFSQFKLPEPKAPTPPAPTAFQQIVQGGKQFISDVGQRGQDFISGWAKYNLIDLLLGVVKDKQQPHPLMGALLDSFGASAGVVADGYKELVGTAIDVFKKNSNKLLLGTPFWPLAGAGAQSIIDGTLDYTKKQIHAAMDTPIGQQGLQFLKDKNALYQNWRMQNPDTARHLDAAGNIINAALWAGGAGAAEAEVGDLARGTLEGARTATEDVLVGAGKAAGKAADYLEAKGAEKATQEVLDLVKEPMTPAKERAALAAGRGVEEGMGPFKKTVLEPSARDLQVAEAAKGVVKVGASDAENLARIDNEISYIHEATREGIRDAQMANPNIKLRMDILDQYLEKAASGEDQKLLFTTDEAAKKAYDAVTTAYKEELANAIAKHPGSAGLEDALDARAALDARMRRVYPNLYKRGLTMEAIGDNARKMAISDIRHAANDFVAESLPEGNAVKNSLKRQTLLFDAEKNLAAHAQKRLGESIASRAVAALKKEPIVRLFSTKAGGAAGAILATEAALHPSTVLAVLHNPVAMGALLTYGTVRIGAKIITSDMVRESLIWALRKAEGWLPADRAAVQEFLDNLPVGNRIRPVGEAPVFKGNENLTTTVLEQLKGKTTTSKQEILDLVKQQGVKQAERDVITKALEDYGDRVPVKKFAAQVESELLPLEATSSSQRGFGGARYKGTSLKGDLRGDVKKYYERIYQSPIETSAGIHHWSGDKEPYTIPVDELLKSEPVESRGFQREAQWTRMNSMGDDAPIKVKDIQVGNILANPQGDLQVVMKVADGQVQLMDATDIEDHLAQYIPEAVQKEGADAVADYFMDHEAAFKRLTKQHAGEILSKPAKLAPKYFAHSRVEEMASQGTRRVIELQSDLFQKDRLFHEMGNQTPQEARQLANENPNSKVLSEIAKRNETLAKLEPYRNTWHERIIREEVKQAAIDGKTKLQFPTGETAMKIEGLGDQSRWEFPNQEPVHPADLKVGLEIANGEQNWIITHIVGDGKFKAVSKDSLDILSEGFSDLGISGPDDTIKAIADGDAEVMQLINSSSNIEQFDISGKVDTNNPIYKFYEKEVGKYLKNKYDAKLITDPQGVKWFEIKVPKDAAKKPVQASAKDKNSNVA